GKMKHMQCDWLDCESTDANILVKDGWLCDRHAEFLRTLKGWILPSEKSQSVRLSLARREHNAGARSFTGDATSEPVSSPFSAFSKDSEDDQEQHSTDGRGDDRTDYSRADVDVQPGQQPCADKGADNANDQVADEAKARSADQLAGEPSGDYADHKYQDQTLIG